MKKIIYLLLVICIGIQIIPIFQVYDSYELETQILKESAAVPIKNAGEIRNPEQFAAEIDEYTKIHGGTVFTLSYMFDNEKERECVDVFVSASQIPKALKSYLSNEQLKQVQEEKILSNQQNDFKTFSNTNEYRLQSFAHIRGKSLNRTYHIYPESQKAHFENYLATQFEVEFYPDSQYEELIGEKDLSLNLVLLLALFVFVAFWVVHQYQLQATKVLLGYSDMSCLIHLIKDFLLILLSSFLSAFLALAIVLLFYNNFSQSSIFFSDVFRNIVSFLLATIVIGTISILLFYSNDIKYILKGKKPYFLLSLCTIGMKIIVLVIICSTWNTAFFSIKQNQDFQKQQIFWEEIGKHHFVEIGNLSLDPEEFEKEGKNIKEFMKQTKGIVAYSNYITTAQEYPINSVNSPYHSKTLYVNKGYLDKNSIYDVHGNVISINDTELAANETIFFVPEKYKNEEKALYDELYQHYDISRYIAIPEEYQKKIAGEIPPVKASIVYVKDNQEYFRYHYSEDGFTDNFLIDPIVVYVTGDNMGGDSCLAFISSNSYMLEVSENQTLDDIYSIASKTDVSKHVYDFPSVYSRVDAKIREYQFEFVKAMLVFAISIIAVFTICIYLTRNYIEANRKLLFVKKMLGYSVGRAYWKYLLMLLLFDVIIFIGAGFIIGSNLFMPVLAVILIDFLLSLLYISIYQTKLKNSVLKGSQ